MDHNLITMSGDATLSDRVVLKAKDRILAGFEVGSESTWRSPFFFVQAADTQLGLISNYGDGTLPDRVRDKILWRFFMIHVAT